MIERDYEPQGYAFQVLKDLGMVNDLAKSLNVTTHMSSLAKTLFQELNEKGFGEKDGISVLELYKSQRENDQ